LRTGVGDWLLSGPATLFPNDSQGSAAAVDDYRSERLLFAVVHPRPDIPLPTSSRHSTGWPEMSANGVHRTSPTRAFFRYRSRNPLTTPFAGADNWRGRIGRQTGGREASAVRTLPHGGQAAREDRRDAPGTAPQMTAEAPPNPATCDGALIRAQDAARSEINVSWGGDSSVGPAAASVAETT
jgi:hypothetical protein